jgi:hypothetical protein
VKRRTVQEMHCPGDNEGSCDAAVIIEIRGEYFTRSTTVELERLAEACGWKKGFCPEHDWQAKLGDKP